MSDTRAIFWAGFLVFYFIFIIGRTGGLSDGQRNQFKSLGAKSDSRDRLKDPVDFFVIVVPVECVSSQ